MVKIISCGNQKGGTGKTATVHAMGEVLAENRKVLMVDLDAQASLTRACGVTPEISMAEVLEGTATIGQAVTQVSENLLLAGASVGMANLTPSPRTLEKALRPAERHLEAIILDLPPSLSHLTVNGLTASSGVIIAARPNLLDIQGLTLFMETVEKARQLNPALEVLGVVLTHYQGWIISMGDIYRQLLDMGLEVFETTIGQSTRVGEAPAAGQSVVSYAPRNKRAQEYRQFATEVMKKW